MLADGVGMQVLMQWVAVEHHSNDQEPGIANLLTGKSCSTCMEASSNIHEMATAEPHLQVLLGSREDTQLSSC